MISKADISVLNTAYANKVAEPKQAKQGVNVTKQGDTSKIDQLKEAIGSKEYKVDIDALSRKIADELL